MPSACNRSAASRCSSSSFALAATNVYTVEDASIGLPRARLVPVVTVPGRVTVLLAAEALPAASCALT